MKSYIGTKVIKAEPAEKDGQEGYKVVYPDGYISWSPKDVFEASYREVSPRETDFLLATNEVSTDLIGKRPDDR